MGEPTSHRTQVRSASIGWSLESEFITFLLYQPMSESTSRSSSQDSNQPYSIHVELPPRFYLLPGGAMCIGTAIGLVRGSRAAGLRFLAENAHRPPSTVRGWYFYNKTKNYKMMLAGLSKAGTDASKLGFTALAWVTFEEGLNHVGWGDIGEIGAGLGTAGVFAGVCE